MMVKKHWSRAIFAASALAAASWMCGAALAQDGEVDEAVDNQIDREIDPAALMQQAKQAGDKKNKKKPDFPPFSEVSEGFEQRVSTAEGKSLYGIWVRDKDGQMLAELPRGFERQKHFVALTMPTGEIFAGLQSGDFHGSWKRFDKRVAFIIPNIDVRSTGDQESKDAIKHHFTDKVVFDVPIVCMGPNGQPVIDMDDLLIGKASLFYGSMGRGLNKSLVEVEKAKAFPENVELAFRVPDSGGTMRTFHYSISVLPDKGSYKPREADPRVGYFTTYYRDLGKYRDEDVWVRYINRWNLEKAEPKLKMSPPKEPIVYYIEHTVPIRYRRWVKEGIEWWNKAFEEIGIVGAIEVRYQDKNTGTHMDLDPEDVRYNFIRWLSNDIGTAIGPSRAHPETGEILDADVVLTDGWIRHFWYQANEFIPQIAMEGFGHETLDWLVKNPSWDPRVRLAPPTERDAVIARIQRQWARGLENPAGMRHPNFLDALMSGNDDLQDFVSSLDPSASLCFAAQGKAMDMAMMGMHLSVLGLLDEDDDGGEGEGKDDDEDEADKIDGIPEWFVGPALADLTCHEVGHTLGLRHNFRASSIYSLKEINSEEVKGNKPQTGSVMDYNPVNVNMGEGEVQGDYVMNGVGEYDKWAIEYGYGFGKPEEVLKRVSEPLVTYATDYDTNGPDPLARRYDFSADPLDYAENRMKIARYHRDNLLEKFVKDGDGWGKARRGYEMTLGLQMSSLSIMANWLGGAFIYKDMKGDPGDRLPIEPVPAEQQRRALMFCVNNAFDEEAFGLSPDLLRHLSIDKWSDPGGGRNAYSDASWPIHDRISGIQASTLTMLLNPTTLRRVYDNEAYIPEDEDAVTLPEVIDTVSYAIWRGILPEDGKPKGKPVFSSTSKASVRRPALSSLRRSLQEEHVERMIDLMMGRGLGVSGDTIATLATYKLRQLNEALTAILQDSADLDPYTVAHLSECNMRIEEVLDADYIRNTADMRGSSGPTYIMLGESQSSK